MTRHKNLGKNIKKFRLENNMSQEILAEKLNVTREYVSMVENGKESISLTRAFLLVDIFNIKTSVLFDVD